jgi:hypothetical protein
MNPFTNFWDETVKPVVKDVVETCKTDLLATHHIGQMYFYIEHDLADDRDPHLRLYPCVGTLTDEGYYKKVHENLSTPEEIAKLRNLGKLLRELESKEYADK